MSTKYVYTFGDGKAEGKADMRNLLGGKGANLAEMNLIGVPVPAGFTITTEVCTLYNQEGKDAVIKLIENDVKAGIAATEKLMNAKFGSKGEAFPLLVSVRSGARVSMPGMMERLYDECKEHSLDVIYSEFNVDEYPGFRITLKPERLYTGREEIEQLRLDIVGAEPNHRSSVKFQCSACKGLYSMKLLSEHHLQFHSERQYISEDMLFNLDVLYHAMQVKTVPWQMYHYCLNGASLSHTYRPDRWPKLLYMLEILDKKGQQFKHQEEFRLRLARTAIFYTRSGIGQEIRRTDISFKEKLRRVTEIMKDTTISSLIKDYPFYNLPLTWKIYGYLLKCKCKWIMFIVMYINNKKRRMTSIKIC